VCLLLELTYDYCAGCAVFQMLMLLNLLPKKACDSCRILFSIKDEWAENRALITVTTKQTTTTSGAASVVKGNSRRKSSAPVKLNFKTSLRDGPNPDETENNVFI